MNLTVIQYDVIMDVIQMGKTALKEDEFIDPYSNEQGYTAAQLMEALMEVERKLIHHNTPT